MLAEVGSNRQQQRTGAGNNHALAANRQAALHYSLQTTRTHDIGQRPTWERQESFPRTGCKDQLLVCELADTIEIFRQQDTGFWLVNYTQSTESSRSRSAHPLNPF